MLLECKIRCQNSLNLTGRGRSPWLILLSPGGIIHIDVDKERFAISIPSAVLADDDRIMQVPVLKLGDIARSNFPSDRFP